MLSAGYLLVADWIPPTPMHEIAPGSSCARHVGMAVRLPAASALSRDQTRASAASMNSLRCHVASSLQIRTAQGNCGDEVATERS